MLDMWTFYLFTFSVWQSLVVTVAYEELNFCGLLVSRSRSELKK